jgi:YjbE family integral membrane protein
MPAIALDPVFWASLGQIILVNIVLSGDNAVVIALAARSLPDAHRQKAVVWGSVAAIVMRIILTIVALEMLRLPYLKLAGSGLLFWIALKLLAPEDEHGEGIASQHTLAGAIRTILVADLVMSLDNVLAVAAAAKGDNGLLMLGLGISIPMVIFGSTVILRLMDRFPVIITLGAAILGYVAGEMLITDPGLQALPFLAHAEWLHTFLPLTAAALVVVLGKWVLGRPAAEGAVPVFVDLAREDEQPRRRTHAPEEK